jgi:hypothetical protein
MARATKIFVSSYWPMPALTSNGACVSAEPWDSIIADEAHLIVRIPFDNV